MTENLQFIIDGEWLTNILRTWFWDENRPYEKCLTLVQSCMGEADINIVKHVTNDILEYRKKFIGANTFELVPDNAPIRYISDKLNEIQRKYDTQKLREDMEANFIKYVDKWATHKSSHPESLRMNNDPRTYEECLKYFGSVGNVFGKEIQFHSGMNTPTECGLWLFHSIPLVYHIIYELDIPAGSYNFWEEIYKATKDDPDFTERTLRYEAWIRRNQERANIMQSIIKHAPSEPTSKHTYGTPEWFDDHFAIKHEVDYNIHPDDIDEWEGLIAPNGDFYSCSFGGHNIKAYHLMIAFPTKFGLPDYQSDPSIKLMDLNLKADQALDKITALGWCATRFLPSMGHYITLPKLPKQLTKSQKDRIFDAMLKHDVQLDTAAFLNE